MNKTGGFISGQNLNSPTTQKSFMKERQNSNSTINNGSRDNMYFDRESKVNGSMMMTGMSKMAECDMN